MIRLTDEEIHGAYCSIQGVNITDEMHNIKRRYMSTKQDIMKEQQRIELDAPTNANQGSPIALFVYYTPPSKAG